MNTSKYLLLVLVAGLFNTACNQSNKSEGSTSANDSAKVDSAKTEVAQDPLFKDDKYRGVYAHYTHLKNALVESNVKEAKLAGEQLEFELKGIKGCENTAKTVSFIADQSDIEKQRTHFIAVSSDIIAMLKHAELSSGKMYVDYCPMADAGKGAYWLSSNKAIENPYYGDKMLKCGEVKEVIEKK
ncbi:MAG: hypothetical protein JWN56_1577 [Sphingobacteriales bacterium]|nr:hypothetical protein [Sphingobacteriales bacterium]